MGSGRLPDLRRSPRPARSTICCPGWERRSHVGWSTWVAAPGNLTVQLARRWPDAVIEALDSSPEMVAAARERGVDASVGDLRTWTPQPDTDVVVSNAAMHWVPEHGELLVRWAGQLAAGSWIAVQMPGNFESPSHTAVRAVAQRDPYAKLLRDIPFQVGTVVDTPSHYAELLVEAGCTVDAWETTYLHQLDRRASSAGLDRAAPRCGQ